MSCDSGVGMRWPVLLCTAVASASVIVVGQQTTTGTQSRPVFRTGVEIVQVDVVVTDQNGHAVHGLRREDFTVLDRKQPRALVNFEEISRTYTASSDPEPLATVPRDVATNTTPRASRLVVLVVDDAVPDDRLEKVKDIAKEVVTTFGSDASLAFLTRSYAHKVEVTEDQASVLREIDGMSSRSAQSPKVARTKRNETTLCPWDVIPQVAEMLRTDDSQRKAIVYISPFCSGGLKEVVQMMEGGTTNLGWETIAAIEALRKANVALYTIDPRGPADYSLGNFDMPDIVTTSGNRGTEAWRTQCVTRSCDPVLQSQDNQRAFTAATGGFAITNTNEIPAGISQILDDFGHYYLLGFEAGDFTDRAYRPVEVAVNRPGLTLRYRRGYQLGPAPASRSKTDPMVAMSTGVLPRTDLPLRLLAVARPSKGKTISLVVALQVGTLSVPAEGSLRESLDITVLAASLQNSKVVGEFLRPRQLQFAPWPGGRSQEPLDYQVVTTVELPPGKYQLRVSAKSAALDKGGSVYGAIDVPNYSKTPLSVGGLVLGYSDPKHHPVSTTLMDPGALPFEPVLDRVFARTDILRLFCQIWRRDGGATSTTTWAELLDAGRHVVARFEGQPKGSGQLANLDVDLVLASLARGAYQLRVTATDGANTDSRSIGLAIK